MTSLAPNQQRSEPAKGRFVRGARQAALLAIIVLAGSAVSACDPIFVLKGSVTVSPSLQRSFSAERRGRLVVVARHEGGGFPHLSWATICEPSHAPLVVPFTFQKTGCGQETVVQARLERVLEADPAGLPACGSKGQSVRVRDDALMASVETTALVGATGCDSANAEVNLILPD